MLIMKEKSFFPRLTMTRRMSKRHSQRLWARMLTFVLLLIGSVSLQAQSPVAYEFPYDDDVVFFYGRSMTMVLNIIENGELLTDVTVAVYSDDEIRGIGKDSEKKPGNVYITVWGKKSVPLFFKIYVNGHLVEVAPKGLTYKTDTDFGITDDPKVIDITGLSKSIDLLDQGDNTQALEDNHAYLADVTLKDRTLYKDGDWNTLCLPFAVSKEALADEKHPFHGATIMELDTEGTYKDNEKTGYDEDKETLYLYFKEVSSIAAGVPYLIKWAKADDYDSADPATRDLVSPVLKGVTIDQSDDAKASMTTTSKDGNVSFVGTNAPTDVAAGEQSMLFMGSGNSLYKQHVDKGGVFRSQRAYFQLNGNAAHARMVVMNLDENETTDIISMEDVRSKTSDVWYTLSGVKLNGKPNTKGVYINNGKKVYIK